MLNVAMGGNVYQDIYSEIASQNLMKHSQEAPRRMPSHTVKLKHGSLLEAIFGKRQLLVNSFHHQAVKQVADGFTVAATAHDGVIEAIERMEPTPVIGIQWHPEAMTAGGNEQMKSLFEHFFALCSK